MSSVSARRSESVFSFFAAMLLNAFSRSTISCPSDVTGTRAE